MNTNSYKLNYNSVGKLRSIALQRMAGGIDILAADVLALANDIEELLKEHDEWKAKAEQWEKEGIWLLHMFEHHHSAKNDPPKGKLSMYLASRIEEIARGEE